MTEANKTGIEAERVTQIACADCAKLLDVSHLPSFSEIKCPECGMAQIVPARFGGFWLIGRLGSGGMGVIYHAMDKELGRHVALKVMKKELGANEEFVQSFKHEAQAAAALNHPNVVQIYSFGQVEGQTYIAMELVSGGRLDEMIAGGTALEETRSLEIHLQVVAGLRAASDVGLVHGDIKPANILFGQNGEAKVVDFGLASFIGQHKQDGAVWGTPYYIAPEKARGKRVDFRSDIYSLGATLFHVLTGHPPFDGATSTDVVMARLNQPAPNLLDSDATLHPETAAMVERMLAVDPTMRYPSYPALQVDMEAASEASRKPLKRTMTVKKALLSSGIPAKPGVSRVFLIRAGIALAAAVVVAALVLGGWAYNRHQARLKAAAAERKQMTEAQEQGATTFGRINALADLIVQISQPVRPLAERIEKIAAASSNLNTAAARAELEIDQALDILNEAEDTQALADIANQDLRAATTYAAAREPARQLESYFNAMIERHNLIQEHNKSAEQILAEAHALQVQFTSAARREREAAAREAARKKAAEDAQRLARKQTEETERLRPKIIQVELDMVDRARGANEALVAQRQFDDAARSLARIKANLTQPESQVHIKNVRDAYQAMAKLKTFAIESVQKAPYRGGWTTGGAARDIIKAGAAHGLTITLGSAGSVDMPWEQVSTAQFVKIINHYMETANLTDEARAELVLGLALLCYESGVYKTADTYAAAAIQINPALKSEVRRLLPGFAEE